MQLHVTQEQFDRACAEAALEPTQSAALWRLLRQASAAAPPALPNASRFDLSHLAYYFGAMIVLGAMGWFMSTAWEAFGGQGIFAIAAIYAVAFLFAGREFLRRDESLRTPGGLLVTLAVGMVPLMTYGLERWAGWWPQDDPGDYAGFHVWVKGGWIVLELATIFAGAIALWFVRFPFLTAPVSFALWFLSMDVTPLLFGKDEWGHHERCLLSLYFGVAMGIVAYVVDVRRGWKGPDYGFWLSLFGVVAFWGGLSLLPDSGELGKLGYAVVNVLLMAIGVALNRRVCVVFGAIGVNYYLGHLAYTVFENSLLFPFALSALGILVIVAGVFYQRRRAGWQAAVRRMLPARYAALVPALHEAR